MDEAIGTAPERGEQTRFTRFVGSLVQTATPECLALRVNDRVVLEIPKSSKPECRLRTDGLSEIAVRQGEAIVLLRRYVVTFVSSEEAVQKVGPHSGCYCWEKKPGSYGCVCADSEGKVETLDFTYC